MSSCEEQIYSNDYVDFIISKDVLDVIDLPGECIQRIEEENDTYFYPRTYFKEFFFPVDSYASIPKCYGLSDETALEVSGILKLQQQPALSFRGEGVMVGFIDTGIDYRNQVFRYSDGSTRIFRIWDQTVRSGKKPEGIGYGSEYTRVQINEALQQEDPLSVVPSMDTNGHGTFVAGVACGSEDIANQFIGAVPLAEIAVVKLKEAKPYLREFYFIPEGVPAYQENDIMMAVSYLDGLARDRDMPLVICLALGSNMGNRGKDGPLATYLDIVARRRKRCVVAAVGNEANARHHFQGKLTDDMEYESVEVSVEEQMSGFFIELWANAPELYAVSVMSPTGEILPRVPYRSGGRQEFLFIFEQTRVSIDYRLTGRRQGNQLIYLRFTNPTQGIWTVNVYPQSTVTGDYNMWLPMQQFTGGNVFFLRSSPEHTLTVPSNADQVISPGGYQVANRSL